MRDQFCCSWVTFKKQESEGEVEGGGEKIGNIHTIIICEPLTTLEAGF